MLFLICGIVNFADAVVNGIPYIVGDNADLLHCVLILLHP